MTREPLLLTVYKPLTIGLQPTYHFLWACTFGATGKLYIKTPLTYAQVQFDVRFKAPLLLELEAADGALSMFQVPPRPVVVSPVSCVLILGFRV